MLLYIWKDLVGTFVLTSRLWLGRMLLCMIEENDFPLVLPLLHSRHQRSVFGLNVAGYLRHILALSGAVFIPFVEVYSIWKISR